MPEERRNRRRGNAVIEFTLLGIPLLCVVISTFEIARGMWNYHTLAFAVKEGVRYAAVHGQDCAIPPNACTATISRISKVIASAGIGIPADSLTLTFTDANGSATTCSLQDCVSAYDSAMWPPTTANAPGQDLRISGSYRFSSAILMVWPGARRTVSPPGVINLSAASGESIQY
jgi:Flp pilus assembly protein TadG